MPLTRNSGVPGGLSATFVFHTTAPFLSGSSANSFPSFVPATTMLLAVRQRTQHRRIADVQVRPVLFRAVLGLLRAEAAAQKRIAGLRLVIPQHLAGLHIDGHHGVGQSWRPARFPNRPCRNKSRGAWRRWSANSTPKLRPARTAARPSNFCAWVWASPARRRSSRPARRCWRSASRRCRATCSTDNRDSPPQILPTRTPAHTGGLRKASATQ